MDGNDAICKLSIVPESVHYKGGISHRRVGDMSELPPNEVIHTGVTRPREVDYNAPFAGCLLGYNCQAAGDNARAVG